MTQAITVYDANNWVRIQFEVGLPTRNIIQHIQQAPGGAIVVWDGLRGNAKRREDFPEYKRTRSRLTDDLRTGFELIRDLLRYIPVTQIRVDGYEADDVIATLASSMKINLYSRDKDLSDLPNVTLMESVTPLCEKGSLRLYKTLVGDSSDNIKGLKGFGKTSFKKLSPYEKAMLTNHFERKTPWESETFPIAKKVQENWEELSIYWKIIGFYPVSDSLIIKSTTVGLDKPFELEARYNEYLL